MVNQQLLDYIKRRLEQGLSQEQIRDSLLANGWQTQDIDEAFASIQNPVSHSPSVPSPVQTIPSLPGATAILGQAWVVYKQRFGIFLGVMVIPILIMIVLVALLTGGGFLGFSLLSAKLATGGIGLFVLLAILFFVVFFITQAWGQTALLYAVKDSQERIGVIESYRRGWHKIISYWWVSLLAGFIILGGFGLLIVPGIIFAIWFSLAAFVLITEDLKGMSALLKSREYVRGKWGSVFWRLFFIGALAFIISLAASFISSLIVIPFASEIFNFLVGLLLTPLVTTYSFLVYRNLRALKGEITFSSTKKKKAAFIFVAILGILIIPAILFSTVFSSIGSAKEKAQDARRQADLMQIRVGLEMYYDDHDSYPSSLNELSPEYFPTLPVDPSTNQSYQYQLEQNGRDYMICAQLKSTKTKKCLTSQF